MASARDRRDRRSTDSGRPARGGGTRDASSVVGLLPVLLATAAMAQAPAEATEATEATSVDPLPALLLVGGVVALGVFLTLSIRSRVERRRATLVPPDEQIRRIKERASARGASEGTEVHLVEVAQRLAAQLDAKAARLELLLAEADRRVTALDGGRGGANGPATSPAPAAPGEHARRSAAAAPEARPPVGRAALPAHGASAGAASTDGASAAPRGTPAPAERAAPIDPLVRSVHELADEGLDAREIARRLDEQVGKVDLILALREDR